MRSLGLTPGVWAVVVEAYDADNVLGASQCIDVIVDADGVTDEVLGGDAGTGLHCTTCPTP